MKRIGITFTETNFKNYPAWFTPRDLGNDLELTILSFEKNNVEDIERCDGFVLTGGIDVDPFFYEGSTDYPNRPAKFLTGRDHFEAKVYWYAKEKGLPVLGICRGMQLIHVLEGGALVQDLGKENAVHKSDGQDKQHAIDIAEGSLLHSITGLKEGMVNSAHHQALDVPLAGSAAGVDNTRSAAQRPVNPGFSLNAMSRNIDGKIVVEGFEYRDKHHQPWMLCVQWHPERMQEKESNPLSQKIKEAFIAAVKNTKS